MRIGLMGFTFTHENKGCEALTYSMLGLISEIYKGEDVTIVNFSGNTDLGDVPRDFPNFKYVTKDLRLGDRKLSIIKNFNECDVVFDVTFGDGFSDIYFVKSVYRNTLIKYIAGKTKTTYVMAPQTYGPFKRKTLEWLAGRAIKNADYVYARDQLSGDYAEKLSKRKATVVTDLAFALPFDKECTVNRKNDFGLNVSGLLWRGGFSSENQFGLTVDYKKYCTDLIDYLLNETDYVVHLIPHVTITSKTAKEGIDSDIVACNELKKLYKDNERVVVAPSYTSPIDVKNYIAKMKYFIGARMHSTIAAFSTGVKTIPFAYSRKFKGLYNNLGYSYVLEACSDSNEEILKKTIRYLNQAEEMEVQQTKAMELIKKNLDYFKKELAQLLEG